MHSPEEQLFEQALDLPPGADRAEFLRTACHGDLQLELRVGQLIAAHESVSSLLDAPAVDPLLQLLSAPASDACGESIGPYKLLELIGEGGMGLVYMAEQEHPIHRRVALKIIKPGMDTRQVIARFEAERRALERLDHPGIARILDAGITPAGRPFFVMELVRGIAVTEFCDQAQLDTRARLDLFIRVCQAVQHAHDAGIIHRDLKPANILVTLHDNVPVPKIIDFGIAKATSGRLVDQTLFTNFLQMIGTPVYMSPEQAQLTSQDVDQRSDVYSLAVLLYELLTGTTPFASERLRSAGCPEVQRIIREEEPPLPSARVATLSGDVLSTVAARRCVDPRRYCQSLRGDLDWIVMRGLEKDRNRRYLTAGELADEIGRYFRHEPVRARRQTAMHRTSKLIRRHRTALAVVAAMIILLMLIAAAERSTAQRAVEVKQYEDSLRRLTYVADINRATEALQRGRLFEARALLDQHTPSETQIDHRGFEWHYLRNRSHAEPRLLEGHLATVYDVAWSRTGKFMATADADGKVIIRDGTTGAPLQTLDLFRGDVNAVEFSADESRIAVAEEAHAFSVWEWRSRREVTRLGGFTRPVAHAFFTSDPDLVLAATVQWTSGDRQTSLFRLSDGEQINGWGGYRVLAIMPSGDQWLCRNPESSLGLEGLTGRSVNVPTKMSDHFESADFSADGTMLVAGSGDGTVRLWRLGDSVELQFEIETATRGRDTCLSADGAWFAACGDDGILHVWDSYTGVEQHTLWTRGGRAWSCDFSPDGTQLAVTRDGGAVEVYPLANLPPVSRVLLQIDDDRALFALDARHEKLAVKAEGATEIIVIDVVHPDRPVTLKPSLHHSVSALTFAEDSESLWVGNTSGLITRLNLNGERLGELKVGFAPAGLCLSPDGRTMATCPPFTTPLTEIDELPARNVAFWDVQQGAGLLELRDPRNIFATSHVVGFVDAERCWLRVPEASRMELWNVRSGKQTTRVFDSSTYAISTAALTCDHALLAVATSEPAIHLWDPATQQDRHVLYYSAQQLIFSPDGRTLAASSAGNVRLWNVATGAVLLQLPAQAGDVRFLAFTGDGKRLILAVRTLSGGKLQVLACDTAAYRHPAD